MSKLQTKKVTTKNLVRASFLTAISIVLTRFLSLTLPIAGLPAVRVGFGQIPVVISGFLFGPTIGGITGAGADLLGMLINPQGQLHPGITLSAALDGIIPGIFGLAYKKRLVNGNYITVFRTFVALFILTVGNAIFLRTFWLTQVLGKGYMILLPARAINAFINLPIQTVIINTIMKYLSKMIDD